jgi:hypothetical protein
LLRYFIREPYAKIAAIAITPAQARHLADWRDAVIRHHLDREPKSLAFLRAMVNVKTPSRYHQAAVPRS